MPPDILVEPPSSAGGCDGNDVENPGAVTAKEEAIGLTIDLNRVYLGAGENAHDSVAHLHTISKRWRQYKVIAALLHGIPR